MRLPQNSPNDAGYVRRSVAFNMLFNYCIHSRGELIKGIESLPLLQRGGRILRGGLSMTELYTKFIVHHRTSSHTCAVQITRAGRNGIDIEVS